MASSGSPRGEQAPSSPRMGSDKEHVHVKSKHLAGHKEQPYDYVRMLYRGMDVGITATSESQEQRVLRSKKCKTTGWQSRFAVPFRALGTPDLYLASKKGNPGEDAGGAEDRGATAAGGHGGITAREMRQFENGVTPAGRPLNWLPEAQRTIMYFGEAVRRNRRAHRSVLLAQLTESEKRVKCVRAGQMATRVLAQGGMDPASATSGGQEAAQSRGEGAGEDDSTFLTGVPAGAGGAGETAIMQMPTTGPRRPNHVPPLRLGTSTTAVDDLLPARAATARLLSGGGGANARGGAATERPSRPPAVGAGASGGVSDRIRHARAEAISGNIALVHPVPPLKLIAEEFANEVDTLTEHMRADLEVKKSERLDTFRRKFKNFELGDSGSSAERTLHAMRLNAEQEKRQNEIYLYQNRQWYFQLRHTVQNQTSPEQKQLLAGIREMVEGGVVFDKNTVKDLVALCTEKSKMDSFSSPPIQAVFDFLCEQFGVVGDQYDEWIEENALPLPESTKQRYEAARQKRLRYACGVGLFSGSFNFNLGLCRCILGLC
jgi:hypothetical protein